MNRKHLIRLLALCLIVSLALVTSLFEPPFARARALPCPATNYPTFGYDMGRSSWNPLECILSSGSSPSYIWQHYYGTTLGTREGISTDGGLAYYGVANTLYAVDNTSGTTVWTFATGGAIQGSATSYLGYLYVGSSDTNLYAFKATTGSLLWVKSLGVPITSTPVAWNGLIIVSLTDNTVAAFNATTGSLIWHTAALGLQLSTPSVFNNQVYVSAEINSAPRSVVYDLDASSGVPQWASPALPALFTVPAVAGGQIYIGTNNAAYSVVALKASSGGIIWTQSLGEPVLGKPAVDGAQVYVVSGSSGRLFALKLTSGVIGWASSAPFGPLYFSNSPTVANGVVYVGGFTGSIGASTGWLYAFTTTGAYLWNRQVAGSVTSPATVVNGWIYIATQLTFVYGFKG